MSKRPTRSHIYQYKVLEVSYDFHTWHDYFAAPTHQELSPELQELADQTTQLLYKLILEAASPLQAKLLTAISTFEEMPTQKELAAHIGVSSQTSVYKLLFGNYNYQKVGDHYIFTHSYGGIKPKLYHVVSNSAELANLYKRMQEIIDNSTFEPEYPWVHSIIHQLFSKQAKLYNMSASKLINLWINHQLVGGLPEELLQTILVEIKGAKGGKFYQVCRKYGLNKAHYMWIAQHRLTPSQIKDIQTSNKTLRQLSQQYGLPTCTLWRYRQQKEQK